MCSMSVEKVSSEGLKSVFKVVIPSNVVETTLDAEAVEKGKNFKMHGFRKGHVPSSIIRKLKKEEIHRDALEKLVTDACNNVLKQNEIKELATKPTFKLENQLEEGKELSLVLTVEKTPEFELKPYDFEISKIVPNVPQSDIEELQKKIMENSPIREDADVAHVIQNSDKVVYKAIYTKNGKTDKNKNISSYVIIPNDVPEDNKFLNQLLGKKVKESFDFTQDDKEGIVYKVTIENIQTVIKNVKPDEYAVKVGFKDLTEWSNAVKKSIESSILSKAYLYHKSQIIEALMKEYSFDLPKTIVEQESKVVLQQIKNEREEKKRKGKKVEEKTDAELMEEYSDTVSKRVLLGYIFNKIAQKEKIVATDDELNQSVFSELQANPNMSNQIVEYYRRNPVMLTYKRAEITERKVVDFLVSNVKTKDEPKTLKETEELVNKLLEEDDDEPKK